MTADGLVEAALRIPADAVVYGANLENHPQAVRRLAQHRRVRGNAAATLEQVRDQRVLRRFCGEVGIAYPPTLLSGEESQAADGRVWLRKRIRSGGGHGVRPWRGEPIDGDHFLQARIEGVAASAAFVADGRDCVLLGLTEQLLGRHDLGASGFAWCGNVLPLALGPTPTVAAAGDALYERVAHMAQLLTARFGLVGLNGLDLVVTPLSDGDVEAHLVEVNPRPSASLELIERAYGVNVFKLHLEALEGRLPEAVPAWPAAGCHAKGVVFARRVSAAPDTDHWLLRGLRDVPRPAQIFKPGHPVCTVLAHGDGRAACMRDLFDQVAAVYAEIEQREEVAREPSAQAGRRARS